MFVFCFQAEDGIRDLVRSRGLGDVYKRQAIELGRTQGNAPAMISGWREIAKICGYYEHRVEAVSYTHLTLPTSDLV